MSTETVYAHIARTPGICGGRPRLAGHRIRIQDIVIEHDGQGLSPDEICDQHSGLTLAEVYSARPENQSVGTLLRSKEVAFVRRDFIERSPMR